MSENISEAPVHAEEKLAGPLPAEGGSGIRRRTEEIPVNATTAHLQDLEKRQPAVFWPWLGGLLAIGLIVVVVVTCSVSSWLNGIQSGINASKPVSAAISTVKVQRSAIYADISFTLVNVQYATDFSDDPIRLGQATVRVVLQVKNATSNAIDLQYYDIVRLLVPGQQPIAPTNLALAAAPLAGSKQTGWIDFPVAKNTSLSALQLQFGNASINETLVTIPVSGSYDGNRFNNRLYHISKVYNYYYGPYGGKHLLVYHLDSVDVRYSYDGTEVSTGEQFYVFNFTVDNPNGVSVTPGYGYDYIRLVVGSNRAPVFNTLPKGFAANARGISGSVVYTAPAGMHSLTLAFLVQYYQGQEEIFVNL